MKANWYAAIRKRDGKEWTCLLGPYRTRAAADAMHLTAYNLVESMFPAEALRVPVHATIKVQGDYTTPGLLNRFVHSHK